MDLLENFLKEIYSNTGKLEVDYFNMNENIETCIRYVKVFLVQKLVQCNVFST